MSKSLLGKKGSVFAATLAAAVSLCMMSATQSAQSAPSQGSQPSTGTQILQNLGTTYLGVNGNWTRQITMLDAPKAIAFQWATTAPNAVGGRWQITNSPTGSPLKTGTVSGAPGAGQSAQFTVDFTGIVPSTAPTILQHYYVRVVPVNASNQTCGMPSNSVDVQYVRGGSSSGN